MDKVEALTEALERLSNLARLSPGGFDRSYYLGSPKHLADLRTVLTDYKAIRQAAALIRGSGR